MVVVDPGVGTQRREIIAVHEGHFFVAPDNGVLTYLLQNKKNTVYQIKESVFFTFRKSSTFAGRDHFAPIAALLAKGIRPGELGDPIHDWRSIEGLSPQRVDDSITGKIVYFDHFGNAITNLTGSLLKERSQGNPLSLSLSGKTFQGLKKAYAEGQQGEGNLILNSSDHLEIFVPGESARDRLNLKLLDAVHLKFIRSLL